MSRLPSGSVVEFEKEGLPSRVVIGVYLHDDPDGLLETLNAIVATTPALYEMVLLADGPTGPVRELLVTLPQLDRIESRERRGPAACFNSLCAAFRADFYLFIESGSLPAGGWLTRLLTVLEREPGYGLAGPSTNRSWNAQQVEGAPHLFFAGLTEAPRCAGAPESDFQTLLPLYSLGAFCYLVKREVIEAIGGADEAYGIGPCWEMDYNIRAARAGFQGVWVKEAYIHRLPVNTNREALERQWLPHARKLYQQRFCGRQLKRESERFALHCEGEECSDFAPVAAIRVELHPPRLGAAQWVKATEESPPLVSCVMPTRGRPRWVGLAIEHFIHQDYPERELLIVYDEEGDIQPRVVHPQIRYLRCRAGCTIGAKRQQGSAAARGEIIAQWDDDDWYSSERLSRQVLPLRLGLADISGLSNTLFFELEKWRFWRATPALYSQLFYQQVAGGTLVYRRALWERSGGYRQISLREDAEFLDMALAMGARLCRIDGRELFIYLRHGSNSWRFNTGDYLDAQAWLPAPEPKMFSPHRQRYRPLAGGAACAKTDRIEVARADKYPLVSCIMPTYNRRRFLPRAIRLFLGQSYPNRELIIIDDGEEEIGDLIPSDKRIRYLRLPERRTTGAKRNTACEMARGDIIVHWDDDDWMSPRWLQLQVDTLRTQQVDICGLSQLYFYAPQQRRAWLYRYDGARPWLAGGTLCYWRSFWQQNRFPDISVGEDNAFVWSGQPKSLTSHSHREDYIATVHGRNTSRKNTADRRWSVCSVEELERLFKKRGETLPPGDVPASGAT
ncbi:MAG: glycosyltransferase [Pseudomonadota bacterium]